MKFLVLLGITLTVLKVESRPTDNNINNISEDLPDVLLETIHQAISCSKDIGPNAEELQQMKLEGILPEDNESFNEYFGCIWKKKGIINDDAIIDSDNLERYLVNLFTMGEEVTPDIAPLVDSTMKKCKNVEGKDYGQKAVKMNNCILNYLYKLLEKGN